MAILRPAEYQHTNPAYAIADSNFVRGGIRTGVADLTALYALDPTPSAPDQFKENATIVYVSGETAYYVLVDISNIGNVNGWAVFNSGGGASNLSGATNGLSLYSGNTYVGLGGTLNQNTCINGSGFTLGFNDLSEFNVTGATTINLRTSGTLHACAGSVGVILGGANAFAYCTDCSANYNCLSIPNVGWVTGQTSTLGGANGLSKVGGNIVLGGALTGATTICAAGNNLIITGATNMAISVIPATPSISIGDFNTTGNVYIDVEPNKINNYVRHPSVASCNSQICTTYDCVVLRHSGNASCSQTLTLANNTACIKTGSATICSSLALQDGSGTLLTKSDNKCAYVQANANASISNYYVGSGTCFTWICQQHNAITVRSCLNPTFGGIKYFENYGTNFTARSLVDKAYVTGLTSQLIASANNGLTKSGTNVRLGGNLTGNTTICSSTSHYNLVLGTPTNYLDCLNSDACCMQFTARDTLVLVANSGGKTLNFNSSANGICVADNTSYGLLYGGDYETNFCPRSLITKQYLTSQISGITSCAITTANNGLTKVGQNVVLGGSLTGNTTICGVDNQLSLGTDASQISKIYLGTTCLMGGNGGNVWVEIAETGQYIALSVADSGYTTTSNMNIYGCQTRLNIGACNSTCKAILDIDARSNGNYALSVCNNIGCVTHSAYMQAAQQWSLDRLYVGASNNMMTCMNNLTKTFTHTIDGNVILSICSGGTARYGVATTAAAITNNADLANKIYVDTCVTSATSGITSCAITTANNGLTKVGQNVVLGGTLSGNTAIDIATNTFKVSHTGDNSCIALSPSEARMMIGCVSQGYNTVVLTPTSLGLTSQSGGTNAAMNLQYGTGNITFVSNGTLRTSHTASGLYYNSSYSGAGGSNPRWIPDNQYVTGLTSQAILTANNGLCKVGTNVCLGGTLAAATTITTGSNLFKLCGGNGNYFQYNVNTLSSQVSGASGCVMQSVSAIPTYNITVCDGADSGFFVMNGNCSALYFNSTSLQICGNCATFNDGNNSQGIVYGGDYETNFCPRSLVTKKYVVDCVNSLTGITSTAITGASNGLTETSNHNAVLGGNLTGSTTIGICGNDITFGGIYTTMYLEDVPLGSATMQFSQTNRTSSFAAYSGATRMVLTCDGAEQGICLLTGPSGIMKVNDTLNYRGFEYGGEYESNFCPRSLITKQYVDNAVTGSSNAVSVCIVSTNYTATPDSAFVGVTGNTIICVSLPASPKLGQRISVADVCNNALINSICVLGNGKCVNGSSFATINTDFGSITFINNGFTWSAVSFIN